MRAVFLASLILASAAPAFAQPAPSAQTAYVERRGLLEADATCSLLTVDIRTAVEGGAAQARGALLRGGWTNDQLVTLEQATARAARSRACDDPRTAQSAAQARDAFASWARTPAMSFPGAERTWSARRHADVAGWRLSQMLPSGGAIGVRDRAGAQEFALMIPLAANDTLAASAELALRDTARARANLDIPGRSLSGLAAGAPSPATAQRFWASARRIETIERRRWAVFVFPAAAFDAMLQLDPRESVEARIGVEARARPILIEVGDIAAARAFLAVGAR